MRLTRSSEGLSLSHSLADIGGLASDTLVGDLRLDNANSDLGFVADIAPLPGGRFAVLDRADSEILVFDRTGSLLNTIGRRGEGPGELESPIALEATAGGKLVVWDETGRLTLFGGSDGRVLAQTRVPPVGEDWQSLFFRGPISMVDRPFQMPLEDLTRRFTATPRSLLVHAQGLQADPSTNDSDSVFYVAVDERFIVLDTVAALPAPPIHLLTVPGPPRAHAAYAARPLVAAGDGWIATSHGRSDSVIVRDLDRDSVITVVRWPHKAQPITDREREQYVLWERELNHRRSDAAARAARAMMPNARVAQITEAILARTPFEATTPQIMGMFGSGACLLLAGFSAADEYRGESLTWLILNVYAGTIEAIVRLPVRGARVRAVGDDAMYASFIDESGLQTVMRFPLQVRGCRRREG